MFRLWANPLVQPTHRKRRAADQVRYAASKGGE